MSTSDYSAPRLDGPRLPGLKALAQARPLSADVWALAALVTLATVIRILTIDNQSFWTDEALTAFEAHQPLGAMVGTMAHVETSPPLYFVLIWAWAHIFGTSEIALRSISMVAGISLVPIAYLSTRELATRWAGVLAAAFVAVNPFMIWYSQEARAYMLLAALTAAAFLWFARALEDPSRKNLSWWAICSGLALMTHYFAGFAIAPEALWLLWRWRERVVVIAVGVVAAVQAAMLPLALLDAGHGVGWIATHPLRNRLGTAAIEWVVSLEYRRTKAVVGLYGACALIIVVALLLLLGRDGRLRRGAIVGAAIGGFAIGASVLLAFVGQDYVLSRNLIPAFVPLVSVVAIACVMPRVRVLGGVLAVTLLATFSIAALDVQTHAYLQRPDWRNVARALGDATVTRAILAADGTTADPLKIYMPGVDWQAPRGRRVRIAEVDVVGATKKLALLVPRRQPGSSLVEPGRRARGSPVPRSLAPAGTRLIARFRVDNWIVARFALEHPRWLSINRLTALAPLFFRRTPQALLVFRQQPRR